MKNIHKTDMESHEIITEGSEVRAPHITNVSRSVMTTVVALAENLCCTVVSYKLVVICNNRVKLACRNEMLIQKLCPH